MTVIPEDLLPADDRFGPGPVKVRPEALEYLSLCDDVLGTSHRQAPVRQLAATVQKGLRELYRLPEGYQVVLGNGGSTMSWDVAVCFLVEQRSAHAVFGEFTRKFARAAAAAPFLADPAITQCDPGAVVLPAQEDAGVVAWTQNETSTGAATPVERIGDGLVLIDATSAAGGMAADISRTDVYYFAPQKNFSSNGGLQVAFYSPAALECVGRIAASDRWISESLNLGVAASNSAKNQTLNTPAIVILLLLEDQINWLPDLGRIDVAEERCRRMSDHLYGWAETSSYATPFVTDPAHRSPVVAIIDLVPGVDATRVIAELRHNGIVDVDPYRALKHNQLRIGTYVSVDQADVEALTACIDHVVERL